MFPFIVRFLFDWLPRIWRRMRMLVIRPAFGSYGRNFKFDPAGFYSFANIHVGDDVSLGYRPCLMAALSRIRIGNKVLFGPHVTIIGGDHNASVVGRYMYDVQEKRPEDDQDVVIEDDVWIGTRVVILKGVTIGRGSVIAAGAVVVKPVPPYSIVAGVPGRVIKRRWDLETIIKHEKMLFPEHQRLSADALRQWEMKESE